MEEICSVRSSSLNGRILGPRRQSSWKRRKKESCKRKLSEQNVSRLYEVLVDIWPRDAQSREPSPEPCSDHCLVVHGLDPKRINWRVRIRGHLFFNVLTLCRTWSTSDGAKVTKRFTPGLIPPSTDSGEGTCRFRINIQTLTDAVV